MSTALSIDLKLSAKENFSRLLRQHQVLTADEDFTVSDLSPYSDSGKNTLARVMVQDKEHAVAWNRVSLVQHTLKVKDYSAKHVQEVLQALPLRLEECISLPPVNLGNGYQVTLTANPDSLLYHGEVHHGLSLITVEDLVTDAVTEPVGEVDYLETLYDAIGVMDSGLVGQTSLDQGVDQSEDLSAIYLNHRGLLS